MLQQVLVLDRVPWIEKTGRSSLLNDGDLFTALFGVIRKELSLAMCKAKMDEHSASLSFHQLHRHDLTCYLSTSFSLLGAIFSVLFFFLPPESGSQEALDTLSNFTSFLRQLRGFRPVSFTGIESSRPAVDVVIVTSGYHAPRVRSIAWVLLGFYGLSFHIAEAEKTQFLGFL